MLYTNSVLRSPILVLMFFKFRNCMTQNSKLFLRMVNHPQLFFMRTGPVMTLKKVILYNGFTDTFRRWDIRF